MWIFFDTGICSRDRNANIAEFMPTARATYEQFAKAVRGRMRDNLTNPALDDYAHLLEQLM